MFVRSDLNIFLYVAALSETVQRIQTEHEYSLKPGQQKRTDESYRPVQLSLCDILYGHLKTAKPNVSNSKFILLYKCIFKDKFHYVIIHRFDIWDGDCPANVL